MKTNKNIEGYLNECNQCEIQATKLISSCQSFLFKKFIEEVSLTYEKAKRSNEEYEIYILTQKCKGYLQEAQNIYNAHNS